MTGLNIPRRIWLNKLSSDKKFKYKLMSRSVFSLSPSSCLAVSLHFSLSIVKYTRLFLSNFRDISHFSTRKTLLYRVFSSECLRQSNSQSKSAALASA